MSVVAPVRYCVRILDAHAHLFRLELHLTQPQPEGQEFLFPAWTPGSYLIREYSRHMVQLSACSDGRHIELAHPYKNYWRAPQGLGNLTLSYDIYAWDRSVRGCHLDQTHGFINGSGLFLQVLGWENQPCEVEFIQPEWEFAQSWQLATAMTPQVRAQNGFGLYRCEDYDELLDHPIEMGQVQRFEFKVCEVPHFIVFSGPCRADFARLCADLTKICEQHAALFGAQVPMQQYIFLTQVIDQGYGGLEHRASSAILCSRGDLPQVGMGRSSPEYRAFLGLLSHEYFHLWNVKRIKPANFMPYDLSQETDTQLLWLFEGFTSYYDDLALVRAGVITTEEYLEALAQSFTRVYRGAGRFKQSITESAQDAWTKFYRQDENAPNAVVSYYTKGALVALGLDLTIRHQTQQQKSLDDVMGALWQQYGLPQIGIQAATVEALFSEICAISLGDFFDLALRSTEDLPLPQLLAQVGIGFHLSPARVSMPKGGYLDPHDSECAPQRDLGLQLKAAEDLALVQLVYEGGDGHLAGLAPGDLIIALDGYQVTSKNLNTLLQQCQVGADVALHYFREGYLMHTHFKLQTELNNTVYLSLDAQGSRDQIAAREAWLAPLK